MIIDDIETIMKVIVVGNGEIGKTSMINRFVKGKFSNEYIKTLGVNFLEKLEYIPSIGQLHTIFIAYFNVRY